MAFDTRWKNPQGADPQQLYLWAQDLIKELRSGSFFPVEADDLPGTADTTTPGLVTLATDAEVRSAATGAKAVIASRIESASTAVALTDAATVAIDWDAGINFTLQVTANRVLGNPTNGQPGTWRTVRVSSSAGPHALTFGSQYGGEPPTLDDILRTST